jgi:cytochrome c-type biogenesis protein CcmH/NrfG
MNWEQLNRELEKNPNDANLWLMRGLIHAKTFEDTEAIECYTKAIKLDPKLVAAYIGRGDAYLTYQKTAEALKDYLRAQTLFKGNSDAKEYFSVQIAMAKCYKTLQQYNLELPIRMDLVKRAGGANEWAALAECQMRNKMVKEASISYQNAIKKNAGQVDLHRQYGEYFATLGDYTNSAQEFSRAINIVVAHGVMDISGNYHLYERRADCYDKLGRTALAIQDRRHAQNWKESIFDVAPVQDARNK